MRPETRHSVVLVVGTGITAVLALVYNIYAGRALGRAAYGDFAAVLSFVALCHIALGPINGTIARFTAQYATESALGKVRALCREVSRRVALWGLIGGALAVAAAKPISSLLNLASPWSFVAGVAVIYVILLLAVTRGAIRGLQAFGSLNINTITEAGVRLIFGVAILAIWCHTVSGLSAYFVALVVAIVVSRVQLRRMWSGHELERIDGAAIKRFTGPLLLMAITTAGLQNVDMLLAKHYAVDADAGGIYGAAFNLSRAVSALVTPFTTFLLPLIAQLHTEGRRIRGTVVRSCGYFLILASGLVVLFAIWPERIVVLLFGEQFAAAGLLLLPLTLTRLFGYLCHLIALAFAATNRFGFLRIYMPGLFVQTALLLVWHESSAQIARISLMTQGAIFIALLIYVITVGFSRPGRAVSSGSPGDSGPGMPV